MFIYIHIHVCVCVCVCVCVHTYIHTHAHTHTHTLAYVHIQEGGWAVVCKELLGKLFKNKRVWPFVRPVDHKALKLGDYTKIVKKPMDLGTVGAKLENGDYKKLQQSGEEFYKDVILTFDNALLYNNEEDEIWGLADSLKGTFEKLWAQCPRPKCCPKDKISGMHQLGLDRAKRSKLQLK